MRRKPFTRDELRHLKFLLKTRDELSEEEATKHIANLIESQKTLPIPPRNSKSTTFQEEFKKLKNNPKYPSHFKDSFGNA